MDFITVNKDKIVFPKKILSLEYLQDKGTITLPIINGELHGFSIEIRLNLNNPVKSIYNEIIQTFPEILQIVEKSFVNYGECTFDINLVFSLFWVYKFYYNYKVNIFLPKIENALSVFNKKFIKDQNYFIKECDITTITLESLEQFELSCMTKIPNVTLFGCSDLTFRDINQRRLNTQLKKIIKKSTIHIFSFTSLKELDLPCLENIQRYEFNNKPLINFNTMFDNISLFDLLDPDPEIYKSNESDFIELISNFVSEGKRIYLSLNMTLEKLKAIETKIKNKNVTISRKDNPDSNVVINSSKTTRLSFLKNKYSVYILLFDNNVDIVNYLKFIGNDQVEIYFDSSKMKNIEDSIASIYKTNKSNNENRLEIKDSDEYKTYENCVEKLPNPVLINEYYTFDSNDSLSKLNLSNLTKNDYDLIRNYVKIKLLNRFDLDIKTCQLSTPCSPKDRSKKLNSLANKISSSDYRCDITCEIFKDYSIGVLVWNETFANRTDIDIENLSGNYVYQTTNGNWKFTSIN